MRAFHDKVKDATDAMLTKMDLQIARSEEEKLKAQMEGSLRAAEATRGEIMKEQEALGAQQHALGEHQAALGAEQAALGRHHDELSRAVEWEMRTLFDNALAAGIATPVK